MYVFVSPPPPKKKKKKTKLWALRNVLLLALDYGAINHVEQDVKIIVNLLVETFVIIC